MKYIFIIIICLLAFACRRDDCRRKICGEFGTCQEGVCQCHLGYELDKNKLCEKVSRSKFVGIYKVTEQCSKHQENYFTELDTTTQIETILMDNLHNFPNNDASCIVQGDRIWIEEQTSQDGFVLVGQGHWTIDSIVLDYTIEKGGIKDSCTCILRSY